MDKTVLDFIFRSIVTEEVSAVITPMEFFACTAASLILGILIAVLYMFRNVYSKGFVLTLAVLPAMVQMVILLVNGNLGTGVAVMGAFSLVRFRSVAGTAKEIGSIFLAMAVGLATGTGYLGIAILFVLIIGAADMIFTCTSFGESKPAQRSLHIMIPESLNYTQVFDEVFKSYLKKWELMQVKTSNMGSLFKLDYQIIMKDTAQEKEFIDALRVKNGNLEILCSRAASAREEL